VGVAAAGGPAGSAVDVECLEYSLHKLILSGYELLHLRVVVAVVGLAVASLTIALIGPHVHHLRDF
jgi:hypothetical protein